MHGSSLQKHRLALGVAALATLGHAQAPQPGDSKAISVSKVERKNKAPVSTEILRVKLPRAIEATLDNGLIVLIIEDHRVPNVAVQLNISAAGALFDPPEAPGLAGAAATLLREGTRTHDSRRLAEEIDKLGATIGANAGWGSTASVLTAQGLSDNLDEWLALLTDVLLNPTFPKDELDKYKERTKAQLNQQRAQPGFLVSERFSRAIYGKHPAAVRSATVESLDALTSEKLQAWHRERYAPQNAILGIAGDVRASELLPKLKSWLLAWKKTALKESLPANPAPAANRRIFLVDRPGSVQTDVTMGNIAIDRRDPDYPKLVVMDRIVGGGASARLFLNLREEKGYTYGVYSQFSALKYPGPWLAGGNMRTEVTDGAMTEFLSELRKIREERVPAAELEQATRSIVAVFALSLEQPTQLLNYSITRKLYGFPEDYWDRYPADLLAVTADDVQRVARRYVNPDALQVAAVGDASKIKAVLEKYGAVEVFDVEGRPALAKAADAIR